jgi:hypothetical protein
MRRSAYLLALVPFALGATMSARSCHSVYTGVRDMDRFEVPGEAEVDLPAGEHIVYTDGPGSFSCAVFAADGTPVALDSPTGKTTYNMGGYSGESLFELDVPAAGRYRFVCEGDYATFSVGRGIGWSIVAIVLWGLLAFFGTALVIAIVAVLRSKKPPPLRAPHEMPTR